MGKRKKRSPDGGRTVGSQEEYIKVQRKISRELELERNGGRWVAVDRIWKDKKLYDRKRDRKIEFDFPASFSLIDQFKAFLS